jgi:hypothetical protein
MPLVRFTAAALERRCAVTGRSREDVEPAVASRDGGTLLLDDTHPAFPSLRGLGDVVATVTTALGVKPCPPCKERQKTWNDAVPFGTKQG